MKLQPSQIQSAANRSGTSASSAWSEEASVFDRLRGPADSARQGQSMLDSDSGSGQRRSLFEPMNIEHHSVVALLSDSEMAREPTIRHSVSSAATNDDNADSVNDNTVSITIPTLVGDVEIETTPNESWEELPGDAAVAIGTASAVVAASTAAAPLTAPVIAIVGTGGAVGVIISATDTDVSVTPNLFTGMVSAIARVFSDFMNPATPNPLTAPQPAATTSNESDIVTSVTSAEDGDWGTDPQGEFGGTPTQPVAEPVSAPPSRPVTDPNRNSDSDTDNESGGGGVSSSTSAENGGWGSSQGGEFG